jgi:hypothetical protein
MGEDINKNFGRTYTSIFLSVLEFIFVVSQAN